MGFLGFGNNQHKKQEALIKALRTKDSGAAVRAFIQAAEDLKEGKTEYVFPIALNTDITKYESPAMTPSHINVCVEYDDVKREFEINYRIMNLNDTEIGTLTSDQLTGYIESNGGISIGASMAHGKNILEARLKMLPTQNKPVSELTQQISMEVQDALVSGVIPENANIFMPLVNQQGIVPVGSDGGYAEGLRVKGDSGAFDSDVSSEKNVLKEHIGKTGLNKKGQITFTIAGLSKNNDGPTPLKMMDKNYIAFGERDLSEYTNAIRQAILQQKSLRDEIEFLITSINENYEQYQIISRTPSDNDKEKTDILNAMAKTDAELRARFNETAAKSHNGKYIDFVLRDPFSMMSPRGYILERTSYDCVAGVDGKIVAGSDESIKEIVDRFNVTVGEIQEKYNIAVNKRQRQQEEYIAQERAMTEKHGLGVTAIAKNASDTYWADLERLKGTRDKQLRSLAETEQYRGLFTDVFRVLDQGSMSKVLGMPIKIFVNPYAPVEEQEKEIEAALTLQTIGDRTRKEEVLETVKALMRDSMDVENSTGTVSVIGMLDVFTILNEHLGQTVTIKDAGTEWTIKIVKSTTKGRDFDFINPETNAAENLTELFVAVHLKPHVTLTTEICQGSSKTTIADKIKGFFKGTIGEAVKNFQKNLLTPGKSQEAISSVGMLSPMSVSMIKEANMAIYGAINCIRESAVAQFEEYKANELNMLAKKLDIASYKGADVIAEKALQAGLINGDKKYNLVMAGAGAKLFGNPEELSFFVASRNQEVKNALGAVYLTYENLAHAIKDNVSLSVEARKDGDIAVKKDLIFPKGKVNKPILIEYEQKDGKFVALPAKNISKEMAMEVIAVAVEAQMFSPFQQAIVQTVETQQIENDTKDFTAVLENAKESAAKSSKEEKSHEELFQKDR